MSTKKFEAIPTYVMMRFLRPFLRTGHPLRSANIRLSEWANGQTDVNKFFNRMMWLSVLILLYCAVVIMK